VERGVRAVLKDHCELQRFDLDAKRLKDHKDFQQKVIAARHLIETWQPDVVITADDDAAKHLLMPFYKDHHIPFVFCGINWTVEEYGFPYTNATGMVEVAPVGSLFDKVAAILPQHERAFYLGANTSSEEKNLQHMQVEAARHGVQLEARLVDTLDAWLSAFRAAQAYDFVILGSYSGIDDWQHEKVREGIRNAQRLSLTNHDWMMPYAMLGFTKVPEEQGEWAAQAALEILAGAVPANMPIVPNRKWDIVVNTVLLSSTGIQLPKPLLQKAKKVY
jgi:ABC-type uncharacterized transport system substrate-binding protein